MCGSSHTQNSALAADRPGLTGPVVADMAATSTRGIAALDARWAALVLAGQAADYAIQPGPGVALRDVLEMLGLVDEARPVGYRPGAGRARNDRCGM